MVCKGILHAGCVGRMIEAKIDDIEGDKRSVQHRSRVMLAGTIVTPDFSVDVRIRNLSRSGALIEGDVMPEAGTIVEVLRNFHSVRAQVVWSKSKSCGVKFAEPVVIEDWVGSGIRAATPAKSATSVAPKEAEEQAAGLLPTWLVAEGSSSAVEDRLTKRVGEEIAYIGRLIENVGADISANPAIAHRHTGSLQNCRHAAALLGEIAQVLLAEDRAQAAARVRTAELKARLLRS
jgi:hypothetical protein